MTFDQFETELLEACDRRDAKQAYAMADKSWQDYQWEQYIAALQIGLTKVEAFDIAKTQTQTRVRFTSYRLSDQGGSF